MAKARRKAGGPTRGRYKRKKMGKGYNKQREVKGHAPPIDRSTPEQKQNPAATNA